MKATEAVYAQLSGTSDVTDIVADRITPFLDPDDCAKPLIVYDCDDNQDLARSYDGAGNLRSYSVKIACISPKYDDELAALSDAVRAALDDQSGTWAGIKVSGVFFETEDDDEIAVTQDGSVVLAVIEQTYTVVIEV